MAIETAMSKKTNTKKAGKMQMSKSVQVGAFKRCSLCGVEWKNRDDFLRDPALFLNGYQGNFRQLLTGKQRQGLLLFTHLVEGCGTTLAFDPTEFKGNR